MIEVEHFYFDIWIFSFMNTMFLVFDDVGKHIHSQSGAHLHCVRFFHLTSVSSWKLRAKLSLLQPRNSDSAV